MTIVALVILIFKIVIALAIVLGIIAAGWKAVMYLKDSDGFRTAFFAVFTVAAIVAFFWFMVRFLNVSHS